MNQVLRLFMEFQKTPDCFLSLEDIRQDVLYLEDASLGSIRTLVWMARIWLQHNAPEYRIVAVVRRGYKLELVGESDDFCSALCPFCRDGVDMS